MKKALIAVLLCLLQACGPEPLDHRLTEADIDFLAGFSLDSLPALPAASSNAFADSEQAALLGRALFFDTRFSANNEVACASCHQSQHYFTDQKALSEGLGQTRRNAPSLLVSAHGPWSYWDGRKDSLWAQALEPLLHPMEQGLTVRKISELVERHYSEAYAASFGALEVETGEQRERVFVNVGKALMAYQRRLSLSDSRFDTFVQVLKRAPKTLTVDDYSPQELHGLRLFMGKANCVSCHNGPLFTNFEFHNVSAPEQRPDDVDLGRWSGIETLRADKYTCLSKWSDANEQQCLEMRFLKSQGPELVGAFKTPSLRNVAATAPYMHAGQLADLAAVVAHYNSPPIPFYDRKQHPNRPHFDILPLKLNDEDQSALVAFMQTLTSPLPTKDKWWPAASH